MAIAAERVSVLSWDDFARRFKWGQGEHVTILGPNGSGKSTVAMELIPRRRFAIALINKPRDAMLQKKLKAEGFHVARDWPPPPPEIAPRVALWPKIDRIEEIGKQGPLFRAALRDAYRQGGWCVLVDELRYIASSEFCGLDDEIKLLEIHGRSLGVSLIGGSQRPAFIPRECLSEPRHLFFFKSNDVADVKRLREIGGVVDPKIVQQEIVRLPRHQFLYLDAWTGNLLSSRVERGS